MSIQCGLCGKTLERRSHVLYLGNSKARFYHPCGHVEVKPVLPKKGKLPTPGISAAEFLAKYWGCNPGCNDECQKCKRQKRLDARRGLTF